jgi:hypothetical protein
VQRSVSHPGKHRCDSSALLTFSSSIKSLRYLPMPYSTPSSVQQATNLIEDRHICSRSLRVHKDTGRYANACPAWPLSLIKPVPIASHTIFGVQAIRGGVLNVSAAHTLSSRPRGQARSIETEVVGHVLDKNMHVSDYSALVFCSRLSHTM